MDYIQNLISLTGDVYDLTKEEVNVLSDFSDEKVGFKESAMINDSQKEYLHSAFRKIANQNKMIKYIEIVVKHIEDKMEEFYKGIDADDAK